MTDLDVGLSFGAGEADGETPLGGSVDISNGDGAQLSFGAGAVWEDGVGAAVTGEFSNEGQLGPNTTYDLEAGVFAITDGRAGAYGNLDIEHDVNGSVFESVHGGLDLDVNNQGEWSACGEAVARTQEFTSLSIYGVMGSRVCGSEEGLDAGAHLGIGRDFNIAIGGGRELDVSVEASPIISTQGMDDPLAGEGRAFTNSDGLGVGFNVEVNF